MTGVVAATQPTTASAVPVRECAAAGL